MVTAPVVCSDPVPDGRTECLLGSHTPLKKGAVGLEEARPPPPPPRHQPLLLAFPLWEGGGRAAGAVASGWQAAEEEGEGEGGQWKGKEPRHPRQ